VHDLQRGKHAVGAVIATAAANRIDVGSHQHRGADICSGTTSGDIAEIVDANTQVGFLQPAAEEIAGGAIFRRKGQASDAPTIRRADASKVAKALVQPVGIDAHGTAPSGVNF
jgi:hypothetical protein